MYNDNMLKNNNILNIGLTENAFHSLKRGIDLKEEWHKSGSDWNLKEAIIWIHHGIELSLKLLLIQKDDFLIFESADDTVRELKKWRKKTGEHISVSDLFKYSDIKTVGFQKGLERVSTILDIHDLSYGMPLHESISELGKYRNQIVHLAISVEKNKINELLSEIIYPFLRVIETRIKDITFEKYFSYILPQLDESDKQINQFIYSLKHSESDFLERMSQRSVFVDMQKTDFNEKQVFFKEGFAETEYFAYKKLLQESARILRDFPQFDKIKVVIPVSREGKIFKTIMETKQFENFAGVKFLYLRSDINNWRDFLNSINKTMILKFADNFVSEQ